MNDRIDVLGIGNAIVDLVVEVDDATIRRHALPRGDMLLTDAGRFAAVLADVEPVDHVCYGGAACNTMGGLAAFGRNVRFIGKVASDPLGDILQREIAAAGVRYDVAPLAAGELATASCLILVTPDGQRTGVTHLGACGELSLADVPERVIAGASLTFLEAYSLDRPPSAQVLWRAGRTARAAARRLAFTLSDPNCVARNRAEIVSFLTAAAVDILFANESEALTLTQAADLPTALAALRKLAPTIAVTRGAAGAVIVAGDATAEIAARPAEPVDTTGAGDLFAAGFLAGWLDNRGAAQAGALGACAAAAIIGHFGSRPRAPLDAICGP
jgi:sugar/nucleoside kinase (ribokinase family)